MIAAFNFINENKSHLLEIKTLWINCNDKIQKKNLWHKTYVYQMTENE